MFTAVAVFCTILGTVFVVLVLVAATQPVPASSDKGDYDDRD